jgi:hypothetical protein
MVDVLTDDELRQALLKGGAAWIRIQAAAHGIMTHPLPPETAAQLRPFFGADVDHAGMAVAPIANPSFYEELLGRGADRRELLNFAGGMDAITFDTAIVLRPGFVASASSQRLSELLFHELVHVVQYRLLGIDRFAAQYIDGWLGGRAQFQDDPMARYANIPLERMAFELQAKYAAAPGVAFSVEAEVRARLGL